MPRSPGQPRRSRGFSVIELMVVVVIAGVLAGIAVPAFSHMVANQRIKRCATSLQIAMATARSEAVKRNASVTLAKIGSTWEAGYRITDSSGAVVQAYNPTPGINVSATTASLVYLLSGRIQTGAAQSFTITASGTSCVYTVRTDAAGRPYVSKTGGC